MNIRSKILVIAPFPTDPLDAGNRARVVNLMAALGKAGHEVHFAHVQTSAFDGEAMARRIGADRLHLLPFVSQPPDGSWLGRRVRQSGRCLGLDKAWTWPLDSWYPDDLTGRLQLLQEAHAFDAVIVNYVFMSKAFEAFPGSCLRILDTHDRMGNRHQRYQQAGMRPQWFSTTPEDELRGLRRADVVIAIQAQEAAEFAQRLAGTQAPRVLTVGHLIELPMPSSRSAQASALFLGSHNPINMHGLTHFLEQVLPRVRTAVPEFTLIVAGPVADQVADQPGVVKLGFVEDLGDAFRAAMIFVSPIFMGTGVAIKVLDAMAQGMPCVCTRSGARGLDTEAGGLDVIDDDDAAGFATRIIELLADPALRSMRGAAARSAAERWNDRQLEALSTLFDRPANDSVG